MSEPHGAAPGDPGAPPAQEPAITARGLTVEGPDGTAFGPIDLDVARGGLHVVQGPSGSGRTTLLLTLAGRFTPGAGDLAVLGEHRHPRIRRQCAIAAFEGIDEIDPAVRVRTAAREQLAWNTAWYRRVPRLDDAAYARLLRPAFGDLPLPPPRAYLQDLGELDTMLLRIALALAPPTRGGAGPQVLVVDDLEQVRSLPEQVELAHRLAAIGEHVTVVAAAINPLPAPAPPHTLYALRTGLPVPSRTKGA